MAGQINLGTGATPATPAAGNTGVHAQSGNDGFGHSIKGRVADVDEFGALRTLTDISRFNFVRNSGMWYGQRQAPGTATTYSSTAGRAFTLDGWAVTNENASVTVRRLDTITTTETGLQGRFYMEFLKITSTGKIELSQCIEGTDTAALRGRTVRVQCWIKATTGTPTYRLGLVQLQNAGATDTLPATYISAHGAGGTDPTLGTNLAYIAPKATVTYDQGTRNGNAIDCSLTTVWRRFSGVFDVPTNCKNLIVMIWSDQQVAATAGINITQVSLTDGAEVQDWSPKALALEYNRICRYYQKSFIDGVLPATNAGVNTGESRGIAGKAGALAEFIPIPFGVTLRADPTITLFNPAAANAQVRDITGAVDTTASTITNARPTGFYVACTGNAATAVGNLLSIHWTADVDL